MLVLLAQSGHPNIRSLFVATMIDAESGVNEFMHFFELSDPRRETISDERVIAVGVDRPLIEKLLV